VELIGISYRHRWSPLTKWSGIFGNDLVTMQASALSFPP
jgi:molybdenum-dependent DNA-binding transcriptional regulator ModE